MPRVLPSHCASVAKPSLPGNSIMAEARYPHLFLSDEVAPKSGEERLNNDTARGLESGASPNGAEITFGGRSPA